MFFLVRIGEAYAATQEAEAAGLTLHHGDEAARGSRGRTLSILVQRGFALLFFCGFPR